jgi:hypothetical protein
MNHDFCLAFVEAVGGWRALRVILNLDIDEFADCVGTNPPHWRAIEASSLRPGRLLVVRAVGYALKLHPTWFARFGNALLSAIEIHRVFPEPSGYKHWELLADMHAAYMVLAANLHAFERHDI